MALDLGKTAHQIETMTDDLRAQQSGKLQRLDNALEVVANFNTNTYEEQRSRSAQTLAPAWRSAPVVNAPPSVRLSAPALPDDFCVVAVDGSHIDVDRHIPARCFLINIGTCVLTYGSQPDAVLTSEPRLYAQNDELVIQDPNAKHQQQYIQGGTLGAKRAVEEIRGLVDAVRKLPADLPTLAMMDGTLIMFIDRGIQEFVVDELVKDGFVAALDELRSLAEERPLAVAAYVSLPAYAEFMRAVRVSTCPHEISDCGVYCGQLPSGSRPCDDSAEGILDREVFARLLDQGQRTAVFNSNDSLVNQSYGDHGISFFYVNSGEEIGRVEIPSWIAQDEAMLGLTHSLVLDQCRRGPGYPVSLMEAHEQAVVTTSDRRYFVELVEDSLQDSHMAVFTSEKNRSKRLRWL
ncbi:MAG: DNA double-strand break repair nuclease NurA [SAR202 cluster bacterium]|jgi:hypothetical protein|nr:DNA double-strand break repair nuclease NurA [SAR202 cluster bacterium]MDP6512980.1 DNA double-strand break repair nuclease NurA [SAR202 cluster bacterium]